MSITHLRPIALDYVELMCFSVFARENYGKKIGLSVYQNVNSTLGVGVNVAQDGANLSLGLGGAFTPDKDTSLRGKVSKT